MEYYYDYEMVRAVGQFTRAHALSKFPHTRNYREMALLYEAYHDLISPSQCDEVMEIVWEYVDNYPEDFAEYLDRPRYSV